MRGAPSLLLQCLLMLPLLQQCCHLTYTEPLKGAYHKKAYVDLGLRTWWSGEFQSAFDGWHRENFGFSSCLVRIHNQLDYALYGKLHADKIVIGKEGYLFEEGYLVAWSGSGAIDEKYAREMATKLLDIQNGLKKRGKTLVVAMAPGKASFFPEFVPTRYAAARKPLNDGEKLVPVLREVGVNLIDYNQEYIARKKASPYPLFGKTGIHWSNYGVACSLQRFIAYVEQVRGADLPEFRIRDVKLGDSLVEPDGDLGELLNFMIPPLHYPMAVVDWEWEPAEGRDLPKLTAFADSFFQQFIHYNLMPGCFREIDYFYYDALVWHSSMSPANNIAWERATKEAAMKSVDESDVVLILATEMNYSGLGFGYLDALHAHLKSEPAVP